MGEAQLDLLERLLHRIGGWAGLRNVLAHLYGSIDLDRLHSALREDKTVLRELARVAARELAS